MNVPIPHPPSPIPYPLLLFARSRPLQLTTEDVEMGEVLGADEAELDLGGADDQGQKILRRKGGAAVDRKAEVRTVFT